MTGQAWPATTHMAGDRASIKRATHMASDHTHGRPSEWTACSPVNGAHDAILNELNGRLELEYDGAVRLVEPTPNPQRGRDS